MITKEDIQSKLEPYVPQVLLQQFMLQLSQADVDNINVQLQQNGKQFAIGTIYALYDAWKANYAHQR